MTTHREIKEVIGVLIAALLAAFLSTASTAAFAGGKTGGGGKQAGGDRPKESISLNFGSQQLSYSKQRPIKTPANGTITHRKAGRGQQ